MIDDKEYNTKDLLVLAGLGPTENGQTFLTITSHHAKAEKVQNALRNLSLFLGRVTVTAEQLNIFDRVRFIALYTFRKMVGLLKLNPVCLLPQFDSEGF